MRKTNWKRAGALALATMMLAGALALPASAAADAAYTKRLRELWEQEWSAPAVYQQGLQQLMQEHPDSPEPYYLYAAERWYGKIDNDEAVTMEEKEELLSYLNTAVALALRKDRPYQSRWSSEAYEDGGPSEDGEEKDYATLASELRMEILSQMPGRQEELNKAIQQYLDCEERGARIRLKEIEKEKDQEEYAWEKEWYTEQLKYDIPNARMELVDIQKWTGTGELSFMHEHWERDQGESVEVRVSQNVSAFAGPRQLLVVLDDQWLTSQPIQSIQRTLDGVVAFVPAGTTVTSVHGGYFGREIPLKTEGETYSDWGATIAKVTFVAV